MTNPDRHPTPDAHRADPVAIFARRVAFLSNVTSGLRALARHLWPIPLVAIGLVLIDAAIAPHASIRIALAALFVALSARAAWTLLRGRERISPMSAARLAEQRLDLNDNAVVNALQLSDTSRSHDDLAASLAQRAIDRGVGVTRDAHATPVLDTRGLARSWLAVLATLALALASIVALPRVWAAGAIRYLDPLGDHPPYCPTIFSMTTTPEEILVGDDATVIVRLGGVVPASVALEVNGAEPGEPPRTVAMSATSAPSDKGAPPREYRLTLRDLREPLLVRAAAETGRGPWIELTPLARPRVTSRTLTVTPPAYTGIPSSIERLDDDSKQTSNALVGSHVTLRVTSSMDIARVRWDGSSDAGEIEVTGSVATQSMSLTKPGQATLSLTPEGPTGLVSRDRAVATVVAVADAPPEIIVRAPAEPGQAAAVLIGATIPVEVLARDDVRITSLAAEWSIVAADGPVHREELIARSTASTQRIGTLVIDPAELAVSPGDVIELWVEASDNRGESFGGAQRTRVGPIHVQVIDEREFRRRSLAQMTIDDLAAPYEELAADAADLASLAGELEDAIDRDDAARARQTREELATGIDTLKQQIDRRLATDPAVDFDDTMREPLEALADRLDEAGRFLERGKEPTDPQDASRASEALSLAAREAVLDIEAPARTLRLAADLHEQLRRLDRIASRQRAVADELTSPAPPTSDRLQALASEQAQLTAEADEVSAELDRLGDLAANSIPGLDEIEGAAGDCARARTAALEAIADARDAPNRPSRDINDALADRALEQAADLALTDLFFATDPVIDSLEDARDTIERDGPRLDEPTTASAAQETRDAIENALEAIDAIDRFLDEARTQIERDSRNSRARAPIGSFMRTALVALIALPQVPPGEAAPEADAVEPWDPLEDAQRSLDNLRLRLRETAAALSPALPTKGASAIDLARAVQDAEIPDAMHGAYDAIMRDDLTLAAERARVAADRLDALYRETTPQGDEPRGSGLDAPLELSRSGNESPPPPEGSEDPGGQSSPRPPSAVDTLSNAKPSSSAPGGSGQAQAAPHPGDRDGFSRAGTVPGQTSAAEPGEQAAGGDSSNPAQAGEPASADADRARRFNERLYSEPADPRAVEGESAGAEPPQDMARLEGEPIGPVTDLRSSLLAAGLGEAQVHAAFDRVPPAYRDLVAEYLLRIASDEARMSGGSAP